MTIKRPISAIIVGAGHRALLYASYAKKNPYKLKIVGVADKIPHRRKAAAKMFDIKDEMCFESSEILVKEKVLADAIINGTMDYQHVETSIPLLAKGYDILLEKPFAVNESEMKRLVAVAEEHDRKVMICHVLRYAPFYISIKEKVLSGEIGAVLNIQTNEHVSYHHMSVGYVRGKWRNSDICHTKMLLAKSCHDIDLIMWIKSGIKPKKTASFGSNFQFRPENKPLGAGKRCLVDCGIEGRCLYSAKKHYIDHPDRWSFYVWESIENDINPSIEQKIESLKEDSIYGKCVWDCDNNVVDHQSVIINFEDGCTATHNMIGGTPKPDRNLHIVGEKGEIQGSFHDSKYVVRKINPSPGCEYDEEEICIDIEGDKSGAFGGHGGGDLRLVDDFVNYLNGEEKSISWTGLEDSIYGHLTTFSADRSLEENRIIEIE